MLAIKINSPEDPISKDVSSPLDMETQAAPQKSEVSDLNLLEDLYEAHKAHRIAEVIQDTSSHIIACCIVDIDRIIDTNVSQEVTRQIAQHIQSKNIQQISQQDIKRHSRIIEILELHSRLHGLTSRIEAAMDEQRLSVLDNMEVRRYKRVMSKLAQELLNRYLHEHGKSVQKSVIKSFKRHMNSVLNPPNEISTENDVELAQITIDVIAKHNKDPLRPGTEKAIYESIIKNY